MIQFDSTHMLHKVKLEVEELVMVKKVLEFTFSMTIHIIFYILQNLGMESCLSRKEGEGGILADKFRSEIKKVFVHGP